MLKNSYYCPLLLITRDDRKSKKKDKKSTDLLVELQPDFTGSPSKDNEGISESSERSGSVSSNSSWDGSESGSGSIGSSISSSGFQNGAPISIFFKESPSSFANGFILPMSK
jgi:hypothetical protein